LHKSFDEIIGGLSSPGDEGENKVTTLEAAIAQNVSPGMTLHFGGEPSAAIRQIMRQFWGHKPHFIIVSGGVSRPYASGLIRYGLASKVITSSQENPYGPPICSNGLSSATPLGHEIEVENWSIYSVEQRLMAGALGVGFMPTNSIAGSAMAQENPESFKMIVDPFDSGVQQAVVKALVPDISFVHGCVADPYGNTILPMPYSDTIWGPRASRNGVVVTVEKVVSTDHIRQYPGLVKLPGYLVKSVCIAPFGSHPHGMATPHVEGFEGYDIDSEFLAVHDQAAPIPGTLDAWMEEWIIGCGSQEQYLKKLGQERMALLKGKAVLEAWEHELAGALASIHTNQKPNTDEIMLIAAAREIKKKAVEKGHRTILSGWGTIGLAAWLAYHWLRQEGYGMDLLWGLGRIGYMPLPGQTNPRGVSHSFTSKILTDTTEIYGVVVGGRNARCISVLGALQIDRFGNINNSQVGPLSLGAGGAGDAINANETIVIVKHSPNRVVEKVDYVTCPGNRIKTLVTSLGVFKKLGDDDEFTLTACLPNGQSPTLEARVRKIKETCGWEIKVAADVVDVSLPTEEELQWLRLLDSHGTLAEE